MTASKSLSAHSSSGSDVRRSIVLARHQAVLLRREPTLLVLVFAGPLLFMFFLEGSVTSTLESSASGIAYVAPAVTAMFSFSLVNVMNYSIFRDHIWGTWPRLRMLGTGMRWILAGKFLVLAAVACLQALIVFTVGGLVYDIDLLLSLPAALATAVAISFVWTSLSLALVSVSNSLGKVNALTQLGLLVLGGLGGGLAPTETMPQIIQWLAPLTPTYWAIEAMTQSTSNDGNFIGVFVALLALLAFSVPLLIVVVRRASLDQRRTT